MKEVPLVQSEQLGELGRALLQAGREAQPPPQAQRRLLAAIGLGLATQLTAQTTAATGFKNALVAHKALAAKWALLGAGGLGAVSAVYVASVDAPVQKPQEPSQHSAAAHAPVAETAPERDPEMAAQSNPSAEQAAEASVKRVPEPALLPRLRHPTRASISAPTPAEKGSSSLAAEVRALDVVRNSIGKGDYALASRQLKAYRARFPSGALVPEARKLTRRIVKMKHTSRAGSEAAGQP